VDGAGGGVGGGGGPPASNLTAPMLTKTNNTNKHTFFIRKPLPSVFCFNALLACLIIGNRSKARHMPKNSSATDYYRNIISCLFKTGCIHIQILFPAGFWARLGANCNEFRQKNDNIMIYTLCKLQNINKKRILFAPNRRVSVFLTEFQLGSRRSIGNNGPSRRNIRQSGSLRCKKTSPGHLEG
jgi:hypothetical protein